MTTIRFCRREYECDICGLKCNWIAFVFNAPYKPYRSDVIYICQHCYGMFVNIKENEK